MKYTLTTFLLMGLCTLLQAQSSSTAIFANATQQATFVERTEEKTRELGEAIATIGNKSLDMSLRRETIDATTEMFLDADRVVEISSKNSDEIRSLTIQKYLNRLFALESYYKVNIEWYDVSFTSNFRRAPDGKYYGTVRIFQKFQGYCMDGKLCYEDITSKDIEVIVELVNIDDGAGANEQYFEVKLGDIRVVETR